MAEVSEYILDVRKRVKAYYEKSLAYGASPAHQNSVGGPLHILLDDHNIDNASILYCIEEAAKRYDKNGIVIASLVLALPYGPERYLAIGMDEGVAEMWWRIECRTNEGEDYQSAQFDEFAKRKW